MDAEVSGTRKFGIPLVDPTKSYNDARIEPCTARGVKKGYNQK